ncbi:MAG: PQQ-binding-like beta-propeller repeat protein [Thermoguttaceae bacterium]
MAAFFLVLLLLVSGGRLGGGLVSLLNFMRNPAENNLERVESFATTIRTPVKQTVQLETSYSPVHGKFESGQGKASLISGSWSQFRGDAFDATFHDPIKLRRDFGKDGPPKKWGISLGEGFAGAAVRNGRVYILDYDMENFRDALRCLSLDDGTEIWRLSYPVRIKKNHGMSRTIPAVTDKYCVSLGPKCHVLCVDAITGEEKWLIDLRHQYGATEPEWYAGQCPIIVPFKNPKDSNSPEIEAAIIAPAGNDALLVALNCETGEELWRTPNPFDWTMTHVSIVPMELDGHATYIYCGKGGVVGVDAQNGQILWSTTEWKIEIATCPSPVVVPGNRIFCCGGYLSGAVMLQIVPNTDVQSANPSGTNHSEKYTAKTLFRLKDAIFGSEQQTPILFDNHLFGVRQRDKEFVCIDLDGNVVWHSGSKGRFGGGPYLLADGMFLILDDNGKLSACEATTAGFRPLFEYEVLEDHGSWAPMALVNGLLLLRDQIYMACLDLRE